MPASGKPLQNVFWLIGERVVRASATATVLGLVARHLQPAGFGELNFALAAVAMGAALANLGLEGIVVSELVQRPAQEGAVLGTALRLRLAGGVFTAALLGLGALGVGGGHPEAPLVAVIALSLVFQPAEVVDLWFQRHLDSRRTVVTRLVATLAGATLKIWLVAQNAALPAFAWAQAAESAFYALGLAWAYSRNPHRAGPWSWNPDIARTLWRRGAPLAISGVVVAFSLRLDQLLVRAWLGGDATGIYYAATRLTEVMLFAGGTLTLSLFPALAAGHARSAGEYEARLQAMFDALSALGWMAALGFMAAGPWVVRLLYGPAYASAATVLAVQGWACIFALSGTARWQFILLSAPTILNLAAALVNVAVLLGIGWWMVPRYGTTGAALAWFAGVVASGYVTSFLFPALRACARAQTRGLLIPFAPSRWRALLRQFHA